MIGLDRKDTGGCHEVCGHREQRGRPMVGGDAHILENIGADEKVIIAGIGAEGRSHQGSSQP